MNIRSINRILIANRAEIACRIAKTCRSLGIQSIAVFSEADRGARHTRSADQAYCIGPAESAKSYLNAAAVIEAAKRSGADAIHPGYGFLSENAAFVEEVERAGLRFIGPSANAMRSVGDKLAAKRIASEAGVPMAPSLAVDLSCANTLTEVKSFAAKVGYPVIIKAAGGGGGRGMRKVYRAEELEEALKGASREASSFFKDSRIFCEKLVEHARHIEVQILGDSHGTVFALSDRDCTLQRNHQKVIEEAPAPGIPEAARAELHASAVRLMQKVGYCNAGTAEFLMGQDGKFYFLEVNSRLQVEHPVTEAILGFDLVALQIRIAEGHALKDLLPFGVPDVRGSAIEARLCAEIPEDNFAASTGLLQRFEISSKCPQSASLRLDQGFERGDRVSHYYDSLLGKLITLAPNRESARLGMSAALKSLEVDGVQTNRSFLLSLLELPEFINLRHDIQIAPSARPTPEQIAHQQLAAAVAALAADCFEKRSVGAVAPDAWDSLAAFRLTGSNLITRNYAFGASTRVEIQATLKGRNELQLNSTSHSLSSELGKRFLGLVRLSEDSERSSAHGCALRIGAGWAPGGELRAIVTRYEDTFWVHTDLFTLPVQEQQERIRNLGSSDQAHSGQLTAHLPGKVLEVKVTEGANVSSGDVLLVLESMKMEHRIEAPMAGVVRKIAVSAGQVVHSGDPLASIEAR